MKTFLTVALALLLGGYVLLVLIVAIAQRRLQYFPTHSDTNAAGRPPFAPWRNEQGEFLGYFRAPAAPKEIVLFFHGNGGEAIDRRWIAPVIPTDFVVVLVEYPGYGARPGVPTETAIFSAAVQAFDVALERWKCPVTVLGESLGTGVASYLAAKRPIRRLSLVSPFAALEDIAARAYWYLPVRWLLRDKYLSTEHLKTVRVPLQVIHGEEDSIVPVAEGQRLVEEYRGENKSITTLPGVGHNDIASWILSAPEAARFRESLR